MLEILEKIQLDISKLLMAECAANSKMAILPAMATRLVRGWIILQNVSKYCLIPSSILLERLDELWFYNANCKPVWQAEFLPKWLNILHYEFTMRIMNDGRWFNLERAMQHVLQDEPYNVYQNIYRLAPLKSTPTNSNNKTADTNCTSTNHLTTKTFIAPRPPWIPEKWQKLSNYWQTHGGEWRWQLPEVNSSSAQIYECSTSSPANLMTRLIAWLNELAEVAIGAANKDSDLDLSLGASAGVARIGIVVANREQARRLWQQLNSALPGSWIFSGQYITTCWRELAGWPTINWHQLNATASGSGFDVCQVLERISGQVSWLDGGDGRNDSKDDSNANPAALIWRQLSQDLAQFTDQLGTLTNPDHIQQWCKLLASQSFDCGLMPPMGYINSEHGSRDWRSTLPALKIVTLEEAWGQNWDYLWLWQLDRQTTKFGAPINPTITQHIQKIWQLPISASDSAATVRYLQRLTAYLFAHTTQQLVIGYYTNDPDCGQHPPAKSWDQYRGQPPLPSSLLPTSQPSSSLQTAHIKHELPQSPILHDKRPEHPGSQPIQTPQPTQTTQKQQAKQKLHTHAERGSKKHATPLERSSLPNQEDLANAAPQQIHDQPKLQRKRNLRRSQSQEDRKEVAVMRHLSQNLQEPQNPQNEQNPQCAQILQDRQPSLKHTTPQITQAPQDLQGILMSQATTIKQPSERRRQLSARRLAAHHACALRAYLQESLRLDNQRPFAKIDQFITPLSRGKLLRTSIDRLWQQIGTYSKLSKLSKAPDDSLNKLLHNAVKASVKELKIAHLADEGVQYFVKMLDRYFTLELARQPFKVKFTDQAYHLTVETDAGFVVQTTTDVQSGVNIDISAAANAEIGADIKTSQNKDACSIAGTTNACDIIGDSYAADINKTKIVSTCAASNINNHQSDNTKTVDHLNIGVNINAVCHKGLDDAPHSKAGTEKIDNVSDNCIDIGNIDAATAVSANINADDNVNNESGDNINADNGNHNSNNNINHDASIITNINYSHAANAGIVGDGSISNKTGGDETSNIGPIVTTRTDLNSHRATGADIGHVSKNIDDGINIAGTSSAHNSLTIGADANNDGRNNNNFSAFNARTATTINNLRKRNVPQTSLPIRIHRLDELADGRKVLVFYKTGQTAPNPWHWTANPIKDLQVPLACLAMAQQGLMIDAITIVHLPAADGASIKTYDLTSIAQLAIKREAFTCGAQDDTGTDSSRESDSNSQEIRNKLIAWWRSRLSTLIKEVAETDSDSLPAANSTSKEYCKGCPYRNGCPQQSAELG